MGRHSTCKECRTLAAQVARKAEPEKFKAAVRKCVANRKGVKLAGLRPRVRSPEYNARKQQRKKINRGYYNEKEAERRAAKQQRSPAWADVKAIRAVYKYAASLRSLGIDCHVDHIVPLRSPCASGLHVHWNLQILLADDNRRKHNKLPEASSEILAAHKAFKF